MYPTEPVNGIDADGQFERVQNWLAKNYGDGLMYLYDNSPTWKFAFNHPYVTGALVGVGGGVAFAYGSVALGGPGYSTAGRFTYKGGEFVFRKGTGKELLRINPLGNSKGSKWYDRLPHFHKASRIGRDLIGRSAHRPWQLFERAAPGSAAKRFADFMARWLNR